MRSEYILVLVLAGAVGGAGLMKLVQRAPQPAVAASRKPDPPVVPAPPTVVPAATPVVPAAQQPESKPVKVAVETPVPRAVERPRPHSYRVPRTVVHFPVVVAKPSPFAPQRPVAMVAQAAPPPAAPAPPVAEKPAEPAPQQSATPQPAAAPPSAPQQSAPPQEPPAVSTPARVEPEPVPPPPPAQPPTVTLNTGTLLPVRLVDGLSSERNAPGDTFAATLDHELVAGGYVIAERGARVEGRVLATTHGGRARADSELVLELNYLNTSDGQRVAILTDSFHKQGEPSRGQDAEKVAGGAVLGAAIGAVVGGGKGAAVGAGVGAGAGAGTVMLGRKPAAMPSETRVTFRLNVPVTLTEQR